MFSAKKRTSSPLAKRSTTKISPFRDSVRRTPIELIAVELEKQSTTQLIAVEREMQNLLELEYKDDVKAYMSEMEVRYSSYTFSTTFPHLNFNITFLDLEEFQFRTRLTERVFFPFC
jgi:hypothetical protein